MWKFLTPGLPWERHQYGDIFHAAFRAVLFSRQDVTDFEESCCGRVNTAHSNQDTKRFILRIAHTASVSLCRYRDPTITYFSRIESRKLPMGRPGKVGLKDTRLSAETVALEIEVHTYNFDVNIATLKDEHVKFIKEQVVPALNDNPYASIVLLGTASKSGEDDYNKTLSVNRATEVKNALSKSGIAISRIMWDGLGNTASESKSNEDDADRAVRMYLNCPITVDKVSLWTDSWSRELEWDDIIGMDTSDKKAINNINIQIDAKGAPRSWTVDGVKSDV